MKLAERVDRRSPAAIRARLGIALALALLPVLILSVAQSSLEFRRDAQNQRANMTAAAERSAAVARSRIESAQALLQTLAPSSLGPDCAQRLAEVGRHLTGYENLIRFDEHGRFVCASAGAPADQLRATRPWFEDLERGAALVVVSAPGQVSGGPPSLFAAVRAQDNAGRFTGAEAAVMSVASLRPDIPDQSIGAGSEMAVVDRHGRYISATDPRRFPTALGRHLAGVGSAGAQVWTAPDRTGRTRLYASAPLIGDQVFVVNSAPETGLVGWAWLNPISTMALPLLAFTLALSAVLIVTERAVMSWIAYLQRIAAIYARGRFTVRSVRAERAPPEIRELAETLDAMAATIVARDGALKEHLEQKDAMLREIHHRVKNNLQVISSLLNMQQRALTDPAARAAMSDTRQRIAALALIYRALYESPDLRRLDLRDFLEELIGQLVAGEGARITPVRTEFVCEPLIIDPDLLAPLALFAVEAISNARKHGLAETGELKVSFAVRGAKAELSISDTGAGGRPPKVGPGVGRTLMTAFARQLRGEASFCANPDGGMTARLRFPTPAGSPMTPVEAGLLPYGGSS